MHVELVEAGENLHGILDVTHHIWRSFTRVEFITKLHFLITLLIQLMGTNFKSKFYIIASFLSLNKASLNSIRKNQILIVCAW